MRLFVAWHAAFSFHPTEPPLSHTGWKSASTSPSPLLLALLALLLLLLQFPLHISLPYLSQLQHQRAKLCFALLRLCFGPPLRLQVARLASSAPWKGSPCERERLLVASELQYTGLGLLWFAPNFVAPNALVALNAGLDLEVSCQKPSAGTRKTCRWL